MSLIESIKMVVTDLDGTLLDKYGQLSTQNLDAIKWLKANGIRFVIATGRPYFSVPPLLSLWKLEGYVDAIIANNGLEIAVTNGPMFYGERMKKEWVHEILETYNSCPGDFCLYHNDVLVGETMSDFMQMVSKKNRIKAQVVDLRDYVQSDIEKLLLACDPKDMVEVEQFHALQNEHRFRGFRSQSYLFEFMHPSVNKMNGILRYCEFMTIDPKQVVAFGDNLNDLEMIQGSGMGVVMENGDPLVKVHAHLIAPHHDEDGFAQVIKTWM